MRYNRKYSVMFLIEPQCRSAHSYCDKILAGFTLVLQISNLKHVSNRQLSDKI